MTSFNLNSLKDSEDYILADSYKVISKILHHSDHKPLHLFLDEDIEFPENLESFFPSKSRVDFREIPGAKYHKGIIGVFEKNQNQELKIIPPFVILNGVTSPENVGAIVRTISGLGFKTLIFDSKSVSPYLRRCIRVSMGNFVFLNIHKCDDLKNLIKDSPYPIYATANDSSALNLNKWNPEMESGFIIGSEGHGIDKEIKDLCDLTVKIPIKTEVQHLNAGHSCAIIASRYLFDISN
jgi:tRNA G18 (ribose-2'-O)-methylase SpoU